MCLSEESAAVRSGARQEEGTPFPRPRAADCCRSPFTASHAMTVSANIIVVTTPVGGGLYALRAGRCGCDSLSLAGSRQRVKSLRSAVRLRLVIHTARLILSRRVFRCAPHTSSEGSQQSASATSRHAIRTGFRSCGRSRAEGIASRCVYVRTRYSPLRSVPSLRRDCPHSARTSLQRTDSATLHGFPRSHLSLPAKASFLSPCLQSHLP